MDIHTKIAYGVKLTLLSGCVLILAGCDKEFSLENADNEKIGNIKLQVTSNFPSPAYATVNGKEFVGEWNRSKIYEHEVAKLHRSISTQSHSEYIRGDSTAQLKQGHATLVSKDNFKLECDFVYRSHFQSGDCYLNDSNQKIFIRQLAKDE